MVDQKLTVDAEWIAVEKAAYEEAQSMTTEQIIARIHELGKAAHNIRLKQMALTQRLEEKKSS